MRRTPEIGIAAIFSRIRFAALRAPGFTVILIRRSLNFRVRDVEAGTGVAFLAPPTEGVGGIINFSFLRVAIIAGDPPLFRLVGKIRGVCADAAAAPAPGTVLVVPFRFFAVNRTVFTVPPRIGGPTLTPTSAAVGPGAAVTCFSTVG